MDTFWYIVKVLPGKERILTEQFNSDISSGKIKNIIRFICPTEKENVVVRNKRMLREKVIYSGYLYFESNKKLDDDELKWISLIPNIMGMSGSRIPVMMNNGDINRILKDDTLDEHTESKRLKYKKGERVIITEGPFKTFEGFVSSICGEKVDLEVRIFGRNTPVSLTLYQIKKV